ncbi:2-oxoglutarate dehydrogenase complex dihydrolipoyllysine-residue succinyltransferase [Aureliella helgolandensis]|uniref:Dihydrolipoyllysine-residue succinyltransferase component of 2-oxoglutarate dehydrogenase complex n=1 Tax=Aureliella helgolandensis TaxID=2527968 RepID=A0A518G666_9BACT|nr:2-oxoglutarate dehydrogenase complex dihydrolipoyllysine-residue succinyltransferase [Aureliella helgolandensis]QDV24077.1 Dihydrolipoyllysine-residue succinyltransferase component of 2-oxoglutarate dehydrogenase complex [Aureliella helgolandensis]
MLEVKVPSVGESISEVQIGQWLKAEGDWVDRDENIVELETEKASVQVPAPEAGYLRKLHKQVEEFAAVGDVLCDIEPAEAPTEPAEAASPASAPAQSTAKPASPDSSAEPRVMPAAQRIMQENGLSASDVTATGPGGRILKEDALAARAKPATQQPKSAPVLESSANLGLTPTPAGGRTEEVKPLSMIRRTIAARLVEAQQTAALLTTFNEVNMQPIMELRKKYRDAFQERHGVKLGFMSFFAKASVEALRRYPTVNAEIRGNNIIYRHYNDIGIAIGGGKGLVVPVLRNVEHMTFADVERTIGDYAAKAMENRLLPDDLEGGTFTISNGGVYGSLLSTPIVNPPQSAILGLHTIQERPMAVNGQVVILPMMNLAMTYDHRIIDGREAVSFLKTIKEICEDPTRLFLEV